MYSKKNFAVAFLSDCLRLHVSHCDVAMLMFSVCFNVVYCYSQLVNSCILIFIFNQSIKTNLYGPIANSFIISKVCLLF